jgi:phosphatidylglycerophosphate synthase
MFAYDMARSMWTRVAVDPLSLRLARRLAPLRWVTPNRVTMVAVLCALGAAWCFATGHLRVGGALFIARYFFDCLDGQLARYQRRGSAVGAAFDIMADVGGIALTFACLTGYLIAEHDLPVAAGLALLAVVVFQNWILAYRKQLAPMVEQGDGGARGYWRSERPGLRQWSRFCLRFGMSPVPWTVEAEILALGLGPLLLPAAWATYLMIGITLFYLVACLVNVRRVLRLARAIDAQRSTDPGHPHE